MEVVGALTAGYAQALRDRTLAEQERISASAFAARVAAEQARWNSEARFEAVFAESVIGIGVGDIDGTILEVNRALCEMLGYSAEEFQAHPIWEFIHPDDTPGVWDQVKSLMSGAIDNVRFEKAYYRKDGAEIWTHLVLSLVRDPQGRPRFVVAMVENITERHHLQTRLAHQAMHDPLTGLPNRTLFFDRLDAALAGRRPGPTRSACATWTWTTSRPSTTPSGHDTGDALLRAVAQRLGAELGREGHLVARMGGDEFVVLVEHSRGIEQLEQVAQTALDTVRRPVVVDGHPIVVSASVGIVQHTDGSTTAGAAALMQAADTTMYWAKADGRDRYALFDADRHHVDISRFSLSARMPEALANGEFVVEYQPLVRLQDQRIIGVEALVRWQLPTGERLPNPSRFIPLAEDTGLIVALGRTHPDRRLPAGRPMAGRRPHHRAADEREPGRPAGPRTRPRRRRGADPRVTPGGPPNCCNSNSPRASSWAPPRTPSPCSATSPTSACASRSTTSAPATPTWPTCAGCPCTP